jgi:pre-mRNA-processing factor 6
MKSAVLERQLGRLDDALNTLQEAIAKYPSFDKLHIIRGQIFTSRGETVQARNAYAQGCKACPKSIPLWILSARLEEKAGVIIKARGLLEKARLFNPKNDELWAESIRIEERAGSTQQAKSVLARGESSLYRARSELTRSNARMPDLADSMGHGYLHGATTTTQRSIRRRAQEGGRAPRGHHRCGASVLGRTQDREDAAVDGECHQGGQRLGRRVGLVAQI